MALICVGETYKRNACAAKLPAAIFTLTPFSVVWSGRLLADAVDPARPVANTVKIAPRGIPVASALLKSAELTTVTVCAAIDSAENKDSGKILGYCVGKGVHCKDP